MVTPTIPFLKVYKLVAKKVKCDSVKTTKKWHFPQPKSVWDIQGKQCMQVRQPLRPQLFH